MFRLLGILCGGFLVMAVVVSYRHLDATSGEQTLTEIVSDIKTSPPVTAARDKLAAVISDTAERIEDQIRVEERPGTEISADDAEVPDDEFVGGSETEALPVVEAEQTAERSRQVFWKPFGTEISANGFAARIKKITGLEIHVVKEAPTRYVVAYLYETETERRLNARIIAERAGVKVAMAGFTRH